MQCPECQNELYVITNIRRRGEPVEVAADGTLVCVFDDETEVSTVLCEGCDYARCATVEEA